MLASGQPTEIAKVLRDMHRLKFDKELSFGERRLLDQALSLLVEEIALAKKSSREEVTARIEALFSAA
jgi:CarD family transcriptional regulator